jgi:hypothetical protein
MLYLSGHRQRRYQREKDAAIRDLVTAAGGLGNVKATATALRSGRRRQTKQRPKPRYALVQIEGSAITILGYARAATKRAVERAFGITDRGDLFAIAVSHIPIQQGSP